MGCDVRRPRACAYGNLRASIREYVYVDAADASGTRNFTQPGINGHPDCGSREVHPTQIGKEPRRRVRCAVCVGI